MLTVQGIYEKGRVQIKESIPDFEKCEVFVTFLPVAYEVKLKGKENSHNSALNKLCGMFKNTGLLSSDDFSKNKRLEKKLEEEKFKYE